jgi:hypothetical protein
MYTATQTKSGSPTLTKRCLTCMFISQDVVNNRITAERKVTFALGSFVLRSEGPYCPIDTQSQTKFFADPLSFLQSSSRPVSLFHPPPLTLHVTDYVYSAPIALSRSSPARDLRIPPCRAFRSASDPTLRFNSSILNKCTKANMIRTLHREGDGLSPVSSVMLGCSFNLFLPCCTSSTVFCLLSSVLMFIYSARFHHVMT